MKVMLEDSWSRDEAFVVFSISQHVLYEAALQNIRKATPFGCNMKANKRGTLCSL